MFNIKTLAFLFCCMLCLVACSTQSEDQTHQGIVATAPTNSSNAAPASANTRQADTHNIPVTVKKRDPKKKRKAFKGSRLFNFSKNSSQARLADFLEASSLKTPQTFVLGNKANDPKLVKEIGSILAAYPHAKVALTDGTTSNAKGKQFQNALIKLGIPKKQFKSNTIKTNTPKGKLALQVVKK